MDGGTDTRAAWEAFFRERCAEAIRSLANAYPDERSLHVDVVDLHRHDPGLVSGLFEAPDATLDVARQVLRDTEPTFDRVNVRLENHPGLIGLETVSSRHVGELVSVEAMIDTVEPPQVALETATHECVACGHRRQSRPGGGEVTVPIWCPECGKEGSLGLLLGESTFIDVQRVQLAEDPDEAGERPRTLGANLSDDLVGTVAIGEPRVVTGIVRPVGREGENRFDLCVDVVSVREELHGRPVADDDRELHDVIRTRWEQLAGR